MELYRPSKLVINFLKQCGEEVRFREGTYILYKNTVYNVWYGTNIRNEDAEVSEREFIDELCRKNEIERRQKVNI